MSAAMANASLSAAGPLGLSRVSSKFVTPGMEAVAEVAPLVNGLPLTYGCVRARETAVGSTKCGAGVDRGGRRRDRESARESLRREACECEWSLKSQSCRATVTPLKSAKWTRLRMYRRPGEKQNGPEAVPASKGVVTAAVERPTSAALPSPSVFVDSLLDAQQQADEATGCEVFRSPSFIALGKECKEALKGLRWPNSKDEEYRFTDLKSLLNDEVLSQIVEIQSKRSCGLQAVEEEPFAWQSSLIDLPCCDLEEASSSRVVVVDGVLTPSLSSFEAFDDGDVIIDRASNLSDVVLARFVEPHLGRIGDGSKKQDVFTLINGAAARDPTVLVIPEGRKLKMPIHIVYYSTCAGGGGVLNLSNARTLVFVGKGAEVDIVEEFVGDSTGGYWANSVTECVVEEGATLRHGYVQEQAREAFHIKRTAVTQKETSRYSLVEAVLGGKVTRHNLQILQLGPDTNTSVSTFMLAGHKQLHDLHSSIVLDHPRGKSNQLHKCIVTDSTGHGVFDGNVKVNRYAQQTDAGQLSRNLLLAPRATVNVKPNLQIIADDVKCTHGATISDLEEEQLFYFRARGIDAVSARSALVFSFGAEVLEEFPYGSLTKRLESTVKRALADEGVAKRRGV